MLKANKTGLNNQGQQMQQAAPQVPQVPQVSQAPQTAVQPPKFATGATIANLNSGILENIENIDSQGGNFVTMDGTNFLYKATEATTDSIELIIAYGRRYYQWVEESADEKIFHNSDSKLDDRYKLRFEVRWDEEDEEGSSQTYQFHMPTASAMRFIDYVKKLANAGYGIGQVVTKMTISRQVQKGTSNRYSRAEFTMIGVVNADGTVSEVAPGITTVGN